MATPTLEHTTDDHRMPLDWHGPYWHGDTYEDAEPVTLSDVLEHLDGEA